MTIFFVEQKVRDDHDSSKKRGQIDNFEKKISAILQNYKEKEVVGFFYFIDDSFTKNKNFYTTEIKKLSKDYGAILHLSYGSNLFEKLDKTAIWDEILNYLKAWKNNIPDLPEINFDKDPQASFAEIRHLKPLVYRKLFANQDLDDLLCVLFPKKLTLNLLNKYFKQKHQNDKGVIYKTLSELCTKTINRIANHSI
jgi:hypothetical protein